MRQATGMHVDDVVQLTAGASFERVVSAAVCVAEQFAAASASLALAIAPLKSLVVGSSRRIATEVRDALAKRGLPIILASSSADLGVDCGGGQQRAAAAQHIRFQKASVRCQRVGVLTREDPTASKLFLTGVLPQATYGMMDQGICPTSRAKLRTMAVKCISPGGYRACPTTAISLHLPRALNPCVAIPVATVQAWLLIWSAASSEDKAEFTLAWRRLRDEAAATR